MMRTVSVHDYGLLITSEMAPYFMLSADKKLGQVPDEIQAAVDDGTFDEKAANNELENYQEPIEAKEAMEIASPAECRMAFVSEFCGEINTMGDAPDMPEVPENEKLQFTYDCELIVYLPLLKAPVMYDRAYVNKAEIVAEIRDELRKINATLPENFDDKTIAKYIVEIDGTTTV